MGPFRLWRQDNVPMFKRGKELICCMLCSRKGGRYVEAFKAQRSTKNQLHLITRQITGSLLDGRQQVFAGLMFQQCQDDLALSGMPCVEAEMETSAREYLSKIARVVLAELATAFTTGFDS